jgi:hypothetical protein
MADATTNNANPTPGPASFPFFTVVAALGGLFLFLGLMWFVAREENPLEAPKPQPAEAKSEPKLDAGAKLDEVKARNQAALDGVGAKMSQRDAHGQLMTGLKGPNDKMPFPTPEPPAPAPPPPKK